MALATASGSRLSEMNVTPLVDVMLVLLIIFMVTVPMADFANPVDFNRGGGRSLPVEPLRVHIGAGDTITLDGQPIAMAELEARFATAALQGMVAGQLDPARQPELRLSADADAEYALLAQVMAAARNRQLQRIGFAD